MSLPHHPYDDLRFTALAHRGGSDLPANRGRENTIAAFRAATDLGYRCLETDVRSTRDGVPVLFHDDTTDRLTGQPGTIENRTADEVAALRVGGEPVPTLDDVIEAFPETRFNIDLKGVGSAEAVARSLARHRADRRVLVNSFSPARLSRFRALTRGHVATGVSVPGIVWTRLVPWLPRLLNSPGVILQIPADRRIGRVSLAVAQSGLITRAHAAGRLVHVWTIDDAETMNHLIDAGVDGLITDRPDTLKEVLVARGLWEADCA